MQMDIQKQEKKICIWLNKEESAELQRNAVLAPLFAELREQKWPYQLPLLMQYQQR